MPRTRISSVRQLMDLRARLVRHDDPEAFEAVKQGAGALSVASERWFYSPPSYLKETFTFAR